MPSNARDESAAPPALTEPVEDYLKAIYELERRDGAASTSDVALALDVAPASVTGMIRRLASHGYLTHVRYKGVQLTEVGRRAALRTIRRHRILESYLTRVLGFAWDSVHMEAERLEHAASDELIERMAAALGHPTVRSARRTHPHGGRHRRAASVRASGRSRGGRARHDGAGERQEPAAAPLSRRNCVAARCRGHAGRARAIRRTLTLRVGDAEPMVGTSLAEQVLVEPRAALVAQAPTTPARGRKGKSEPR